MSHWHSWRPTLVLTFVALLGSARLARAAAGDASAADEAKARALATEAWRLTELQRPAEACARYRQALGLKRSPGLLNAVGLCFKQEGDVLRALETFEDSLQLAGQQEQGAKRDAWEQLARQELAGLEAQVGRLVLRLPRLAGLSVRIDGKLLPAGTELVPVRSGLHQLDVSAPARISHSAQLSVAAGARLLVEVPELAAVAQQAPPPPGPDAPPERHPAARTLPWVLLGTGSAVLAAGVVTGVVATLKDRELDRSCSGAGCPDPSWQSKIDEAETFARVTNVLWGVGLATLGVGVTLLIVDAGAPEGSEPEVQAACHLGSCGLQLDGRF